MSPRRAAVVERRQPGVVALTGLARGLIRWCQVAGKAGVGREKTEDAYAQPPPGAGAHEAPVADVDAVDLV
ncbi:hypothetical protein OG453_38115 [Streptomyces sp. NBC_01381]|uniref:hypothetical protein n=1 Tax=Streptomyces sp. NBC_01381 TaxID=2903845 RepID=UPI0022501B17|nr:hypothetical protein [Streptomyces sp. NBC_01381]MCX4672408.1 hypothetical protein [Streptomyces sp. NBC_01381]